MTLRGQQRGRIEDPVLVIGPGRSGTTLLARALALHPHVAWFSGANDRWPGRPWVSAASRVARAPLPSSITDRIPRFPKIGETYGVWDATFPGFSLADRDWTPGDVTNDQRQAFRRLVADVCRWQGGDRFLAKITGWPRVELLRSLLPGVRIVHIDRDPRAVVASWIKQGWLGYKRQREAQAALSPESLVELYGGDYLAKWHAFQPYRDAPDVVALRYEDLVEAFMPSMRELARSLDLAMDRRFARRLGDVTVTPANDAWRRDIAPATLALLEDRLAEPIAVGGYPSSDARA